MDKIRKVLIPILTFILLFIPFNTQIVNVICPNTWIVIMLEFISCFGLLFLGRIRKISIRDFILLFIILFTLIFVLRKNYYIVEDRIGTVIQFCIYLFCIFSITLNKFSIKPFFEQLKIVCLINVFATLLIQLFPSLYVNVLYPFISNGKILISLANFNNGFNPGLAAHYSVNAIYLSISTLYFFSNYMDTRKSKNLFFLLISFIALLLTAKRAHILITFCICFITFLKVFKQYISSKIFYGTFLLIILIILFFSLSIFIPQLNTFLVRFVESSESGDLLSGRNILYNLCINIWKNNIFIGNGWGAFSYYYHIVLYNSVYVVEYADAHNIYLQLLCEVGVIGFIYFITLICFNLKNIYDKIKIYRYNRYVLFIFCFQLFFVIYGLSGNPLYDIQCYSLYFIISGILLSINFNHLEVSEL